MFEYRSRIYLHHTDAAGRLFFANQFYLIHEAKEEFFRSLGLDIASILSDPRYTFPLVHAESDYKALLQTGDEVVIQVRIEKIGETSVTFAFNIYKTDGTLAGTSRTVNVAVDRKTSLKTPLPQAWLDCLAKAT